MEALQLLGQGFATCFTPLNLSFIVIGVLIGQIIGALPGIGPAAGMALLLPLTYGVPPATAIMMLAGIMYGGMYGGTLTSVLVNVPGEAASVMTAVDGHQMARKGRAGAALSISAIGSFLAGVAAVIAVVFVTPPLAAFALKFNAPEYFLLALLGITASASLGTNSPTKAFMAALLGLMIAMVGVDSIQGTQRLIFGQQSLLEGIDFLPVAIGIFGVAEVLASLERLQAVQPMRTRLRDMWLTALILHGIRPGPGLMTEQSTLVWGLIASMFIGNLVLLVLNLPLAPLFAALLRVRYEYLAPGILAISLVGAYASTLAFTNVWISLAFGIVGWFMIKLDFPRAPLVLALVLAPLLESSLRQSLLLPFGSLAIFVERPLSAALLACVVASLLLPAAGALRRRAVRNAG